MESTGGLSSAAEKRLLGVSTAARVNAQPKGETEMQRKHRLAEEKEKRLERAGLVSHIVKSSKPTNLRLDTILDKENEALPLPPPLLKEKTVGDKREASLLGRALSHGIRLAVTQDNLQPSRRTTMMDFSQEVEHLPYMELQGGRGIQFRLTDWCPVVFRNLRESQGISHEEYLVALGENPLQGGEQGSGKSGAVFFKSYDDKFIVKEVKRSERDALLRILPSMVNYLTTHEFSFLPRFLGLYTVEATPGLFPTSMTIIVMRNVLQFAAPGEDSEYVFSEVYDLKGSVHNRFTSSPHCNSFHGKGDFPCLPTPRERNASLESRRPATDQENEYTSVQTRTRAQSSPPNSACTSPSQKSVSASQVPATPKLTQCVLKDLNLRSKFVLGPQRKAVLMEQLQQDVEWLEKHNLMDYSLLLGVTSTETLQQHTYTTALQTPGMESDADQFACDDVDSSFELYNEEDEVDSELGAILRRNNQRRRESAALIPEGAFIKSIKLIGHGQAKRSRESSTIFRSNCTIYTFLVTRNDALTSCSARSSPRTEPDTPRSNISDTAPRSSNDWVIFRRYKDFEKLHRGLQEELKSANSAHKLPALPKKQRIGFMEPQFVKRREQELEKWIQSILALVGYRIDSPHLHEFLTSKANRCPPKWKAQDNLRQLVHRKTSVSYALEKSNLESDLQGMEMETASCTSTSTLSNPLPRDNNNRSIWRTLGNQTHQDIPAVRVTSSALHRPSPEQPVRLFIGVIDILQEFNLTKKLESVFKGLTQHADGISAVDPERYGERFLNFMDEFVFE